jgi:hypothetical protein
VLFQSNYNKYQYHVHLLLLVVVGELAAAAFFDSALLKVLEGIPEVALSFLEALVDLSVPLPPLGELMEAFF